tara:strand:- start:90 stop:845 length:756 start_codon:yes stop_codon:yes gene_type:complete
MNDKNPFLDHIIITGGLSGIGLETLKVISHNNPKSKIIITSREHESGFKKLKQAFPESKNIELLELDLSKDISVDNFLKEIKKNCKQIFSLILNGGFIETSPCLMTTQNSIEEHLKINYTNNIKIVQFIVRKYMLKQKHGSVVNISSSAAKFANGGRLAYAASKAAMTLAIKVMSRELGKNNITFNSISPGLTESKLMRNSTDEDKIEDYLNCVDNRRIGMPREIAYLINFLISDKNTHITGQDISIDGGI